MGEYNYTSPTNLPLKASHLEVLGLLHLKYYIYSSGTDHFFLFFLKYLKCELSHIYSIQPDCIQWCCPKLGEVVMFCQRQPANQQKACFVSFRPLHNYLLFLSKEITDITRILHFRKGTALIYIYSYINISRQLKLLLKFSEKVFRVEVFWPWLAS